MYLLEGKCTVEPQWNGTHYSKHLGIANATKAIVRAIVTNSLPISNGFQYNEHLTVANAYTEVLLYIYL